MSIAHHTLLASPSLDTGWVARVKDVMAGLVGEWEVRRGLRHLETLDAGALHDIGLAPGSLEGAVRHGRRALTGPAPWPVAARLPARVTEWG